MTRFDTGLEIRGAYKQFAKGNLQTIYSPIFNSCFSSFQMRIKQKPACLLDKTCAREIIEKVFALPYLWDKIRLSQLKKINLLRFQIC